KQNSVICNVCVSYGNKNMVSLNECIVFTRVFHFAMDQRCFAHWVCGCANCVRYIEKQNKAVKIVFKQSRKTVIAQTCRKDLTHGTDNSSNYKVFIHFERESVHYV